MIAILKHVPIWVLPLFLFLVVRGWQARRERMVSVPMALILPLLMAVWSVSSALSMHGAGLPLYLLAASLTGACCWFSGYSRGVEMDTASGKVRLPGDRTLLWVLLVNFVIHFVAGALQSQAPQLVTQPAVANGLAIAYGLFCGVFVVRLAAILQCLAQPRLANA